tara:strand:+ start:1256 stop:1519 length:264 start_codon:yes stop_codon:yes gene_type:complete
LRIGLNIWIKVEVRGGYVIIETRPKWDSAASPRIKLPVAKIILHRPSGKWKVYWKRASGRWGFYSEYKSIDGALRAIDKDVYCCFWG